jgi:hypothetical protein
MFCPNYTEITEFRERRLRLSSLFVEVPKWYDPGDKETSEAPEVAGSVLPDTATVDWYLLRVGL